MNFDGDEELIFSEAGSGCFYEKYDGTKGTTNWCLNNVLVDELYN